MVSRLISIIATLAVLLAIVGYGSICHAEEVGDDVGDYPSSLLLISRGPEGNFLACLFEVGGTRHGILSVLSYSRETGIHAAAGVDGGFINQNIVVVLIHGEGRLKKRGMTIQNCGGGSALVINNNGMQQRWQDLGLGVFEESDSGAWSAYGLVHFKSFPDPATSRDEVEGFMSIGGIRSMVENGELVVEPDPRNPIFLNE